ncbi:UDP-glucosyltransferase 2-like isoform X2 [Portunus trituberculatus]|uniref:UDP-glucosyltransferase 2-like isoform X2 n=1 Tax=Portunus trituberculatus TaxID=210409 RepID=UPI001E1CE42C|nr:UDP-glucosyltransferase 2-like isoform X2 [Portunus trituberculatus]
MKTTTRRVMHLFATLVVVVASAAVSASEQYRVLIVTPVASRSQYHLCAAIAEGLGEAGHEVTFVSSFKLKHTSKYGVQHVHSGGDNSMMEEMNLFDIHENPNIMFSTFTQVYKNIGHNMWANDEIKQLWHERNKFHAIITISYANEVISPFLLDYQGVFVTLCTPGIELRTISYQGNWLPFSSVPTLLTDFTQDMTFIERVINPLNFIFYRIVYIFTVLPVAQSIVQDYFPGMPPIETLYENSSLTLINGHFSIDGQVPLLPTQVEIGTISTNKPRPLPQDLEDFMGGAGEAGVILFSLGSIARSTHMPGKYKDVLVEAFRSLPQRVIWKYEGDDLQLPPNVITTAWVPQQDILRHNKTRLFISHCGNLGVQEAQYNGVPILGMPLAFDQLRNAQRMAKNGYGLALDWNDLTVESLLDAIHTLLTPRYREKLQAVSKALHDQKESPKERATWWVEYAIRNKGAPHMTYSGKRLHFLQYVMVDVMLFLVAVVAAWLLLSILCLRRLIRCCRRPQKHALQETKKQK